MDGICRWHLPAALARFTHIGCLARPHAGSRRGEDEDPKRPWFCGWPAFPFNFFPLVAMSTYPVAWQFWIDAGGTFTDCIARRPDGTLATHKLLSTGRYPTRAHPDSTPLRWVDPALACAPGGYFTGYTLCCLVRGYGWVERRVEGHGNSGIMHLSEPLPAGLEDDAPGELFSPEEAPVAGIRWLLGLPLSAPLGRLQVRLGTTRATNALLERRGARLALITTAGFADGLRIGHQDRPDLFDLHISQPPELYAASFGVPERLAADGTVLQSLDEAAAYAGLAALRANGIESLAVCLLHAYLNPVHEQRLGQIAVELGFPHVSLSHRISPLPKFVYRGDTTVLDAYLTPVLRDYCRRLAAQLPDADLRFMTSAGSLVSLENFSGKDAILSGPAGGVVGTARVTDRAGVAPAFAFDMGGTSTDVSRWNGENFARRYETEAAGSHIRRHRLQTSMLEIETVAAGGGSICWFDGEKLAVGPRSAGADPGPACYGRGGPLTVTDLNFYLGRVSTLPLRAGPRRRRSSPGRTRCPRRRRQRHRPHPRGSCRRFPAHCQRRDGRSHQEACRLARRRRAHAHPRRLRRRGRAARLRRRA